jgi:dTDP-4-dehydrorhamnose 3,5-epimerase
MDIKTFPLNGLKLITLKAFADDRGFFTERFKSNSFANEGLHEFVQDNFSRSKPGVLRGLHYQWDKPQGKLVTCLRGRILDIAVDIRVNSSTFGQHVAIELSGDNPSWFWIPPGFAHGFCVLGNEEADVMYKVNNYWNGAGESGIAWNDPELGIKWPIAQPLLSPKDAALQSWSAYKSDPKFISK